MGIILLDSNSLRLPTRTCLHPNGKVQAEGFLISISRFLHCLLSKIYVPLLSSMGSLPASVLMVKRNTQDRNQTKSVNYWSPPCTTVTDWSRNCNFTSATNDLIRHKAVMMCCWFHLSLTFTFSFLLIFREL